VTVKVNEAGSVSVTGNGLVPAEAHGNGGSSATIAKPQTLRVTAKSSN
jgi:hypothetical protein